MRIILCLLLSLILLGCSDAKDEESNHLKDFYKSQAATLNNLVVEIGSKQGSIFGNKDLIFNDVAVLWKDKYKFETPVHSIFVKDGFTGVFYYPDGRITFATNDENNRKGNSLSLMFSPVKLRKGDSFVYGRCIVRDVIDENWSIVEWSK